MNLRTWQQQWIDVAGRALKSVGVAALDACPGAGKTIACLALSSWFDVVFSVGPTRKVRSQWARSAYALGRKMAVVRPGLRPQGYDGFSLVYHQLNQPKSQKMISTIVDRYKEKALVILDEPHHVATKSRWHDGLTAFDGASIVLASGTPFRTDRKSIPYLRYDKKFDPIVRRNSLTPVTDYAYTYRQAVDDGVCRVVRFTVLDGEVNYSIDGKKAKCQISNATSDIAARIYNTACDGELARSLIDMGITQLNELRRNQPDAGGLIICRDIKHAKKIKLLFDSIGEDAEIVTSDSDEAVKRLSLYERGASKWLVTVAMVSEGVDIPRLRVCVYLTSKKTELFFLQSLGRIVRKRPNETDERAYFYCLADKGLKHFVQNVERSLDRSFFEKNEQGGLGFEPSGYFVDFQPGAGTLALIEQFERGELVDLKRLYQPTPQEYADDLRRVASRAAARKAHIKGVQVADIHKEWLKRGGQRQAIATNSDLEAKIRWLTTF